MILVLKFYFVSKLFQPLFTKNRQCITGRIILISGMQIHFADNFLKVIGNYLFTVKPLKKCEGKKDQNNALTTQV
jgi:hypothetical protein